MEGFYLALGVSVLLPFLQWTFPTIPRIVAYTGTTSSIVVALSEFLDPPMKPPLSAVVFFLIGISCIGVATHIYIQHLKRAPAAPSSEKVAQKSAAELSEKLAQKPAAEAPSPFLEATDNSEIKARNVVVAGTLPGIKQFARVAGGSSLDMSGSLILGPDAPTVFPEPDADHQRLTTNELLDRVHELTTQLKRFQQDHDSRKVDQRATAYRDKDLWWQKVKQNKELFERDGLLFNQQFREKALALASAMLFKTGGVNLSEAAPQQQAGAQVILQGWAGGSPASDAADFLEFLAKRLKS